MPVLRGSWVLQRAGAAGRVVMRRPPVFSAVVIMLVSLVCLAASAPSFAQRQPLGPQCVFNDECAAGLICSAGYCRAQCRTPRDCARGDVCQLLVIDREERILRKPAADEAVASDTRELVAERGHYVRNRCVPQGFVAPERQPVVAPGTAVPAVVRPGTPVAPGSAEPVIEPDTNRAGSDYKSIESPDGADVCAATCTGDERCRSWTWVKPGLQARTAVCWLKDGVPAATRDACCASGVKR